MTRREIIDRARAAYEAVRRPNEVSFDQRSRVIQEAWIKNQEQAGKKTRRPSDQRAASHTES